MFRKPTFAVIIVTLAFLLATTARWPVAGYAASVRPPGPPAKSQAASPTPPPYPQRCRAERSPTGNFKVNCTGSDSRIFYDFQLDQSEPSVVAFHQKVVTAFNDNYGAASNPRSRMGYSVSHDGGSTWTDMGSVPATPTVQPESDPSLAVDEEGNVWLTSIASDGTVDPPIYKLAFYEMPVHSDTFQLVSNPVVAAPGFLNLTDKELLAVGRDGLGRRHFYITYTQYGHSPGLIQGPIVLLDSTDGLTWRSTQLTESTLCEPIVPGASPVPDGDRLYVFFNDIDHAACANDPFVDPTVASGRQEVVVVGVPTATILGRTTIASIHGNGDLVDPNCGQQVIETAPGLNGRNAPIPQPTLGPDGVLYVAWSDRPAGLGGGFENATRISLSYSVDGGVTWSHPQVISGPLSTAHMADRFQPALTSDDYGLHAIWYERVVDPGGGPDLIRTDRADLSLAANPDTRARSRGGFSDPVLLDGGERALSTVPWQFLPAVQTGCYAGDYNQVFSNGVTVFAAWTDLRDTAPTVEGGIAQQSDIFSDHWLVRRTNK